MADLRGEGVYTNDGRTRGDLYERRTLVLEVLIVVLFVIDQLVLVLGR